MSRYFGVSEVTTTSISLNWELTRSLPPPAHWRMHWQPQQSSFTTVRRSPPSGARSQWRSSTPQRVIASVSCPTITRILLRFRRPQHQSSLQSRRHIAHKRISARVEQRTAEVGEAIRCARCPVLWFERLRRASSTSRKSAPVWTRALVCRLMWCSWRPSRRASRSRWWRSRCIWCFCSCSRAASASSAPARRAQRRRRRAQ